MPARSAWRTFWLSWLFWLIASVFPATAGELAKADLERRFRSPLHVGDQLREIPAWPIRSELEPDAGPVGYVFESIDLAPIPGFEGSPFNLLVAIDRHGAFIDVEVLRQHEPVFLGGLGEAPLHEFVRQYAGKRLQQEITIASPYGDARSGGGANRVVLDGVTKATASVRIVNQTVLAAALAVARARLKFGAAPGAAAKPRLDLFERLDVAELRRSGAIGELRLRNAEVERLFAGSEGAGIDEIANADPGGLFVELLVGYLNVPSIGRAILGDAEYAALMGRLAPGQHAYWIASRGRLPIVDERFVPGTVPPQLALTQGGLPLELRDSGSDPPPARIPGVDAARIFLVERHAGLNPAAAVELQLTIARSRGTVLLRTSTQTARLAYTAPGRYFEIPPQPLPEWLKSWRDRWPDLAFIALALLLLALALTRTRWLGADPKRLTWFRNGFLAFTLIYLGWHAQGQLSIVQITGAIKALSAGQGLASFLYDPVSLLLILFTAISLVAWGRGTFCGWLCPYGALQEFIALAAHRFGLHQRKLPPRFDRWLRRSRVPLLASLLLLAAFAPNWAARAVEIEPFKTVITVGFQRDAVFVAYAALTLLAGAFCYKFFCRYLCPLGTALQLGGKLRRWRWLERRPECGQPCQRCRHRCEYDAIRRDGSIDYDACFQCLDCVAIHHDPQRCAPLLLLGRKHRQVRIRSADADQRPAFGASKV